MQVTCGGDWFLPSNNKRFYAVGFDLDDLRFRKGDEYVDSLSYDERVRELGKLADAYVIKYVTENGGMPQEVAMKRLQELTHE